MLLQCTSIIFMNREWLCYSVGHDMALASPFSESFSCLSYLSLCANNTGYIADSFCVGLKMSQWLFSKTLWLWILRFCLDYACIFFQHCKAYDNQSLPFFPLFFWREQCLVHKDITLILPSTYIFNIFFNGITDQYCLHWGFIRGIPIKHSTDLVKWLTNKPVLVGMPYFWLYHITTQIFF